MKKSFSFQNKLSQGHTRRNIVKNGDLQTRTLDRNTCIGFVSTHVKLSIHRAQTSHSCMWKQDAGVQVFQHIGGHARGPVEILLTSSSTTSTAHCPSWIPVTTRSVQTRFSARNASGQRTVGDTRGVGARARWMTWQWCMTRVGVNKLRV